MDLPAGKFVKRDVSLDELRIEDVIKELGREKFDGYVRISILISPGVYKDRYLLFESGRLVGCEAEVGDEIKYGEAALESLFDFGGKTGYVDVVRLEKLELEAAKEWNRNALLKEGMRLFGDISKFELAVEPDKDVYVRGEQLKLKVGISAGADGVFALLIRFEVGDDVIELEDKVKVENGRAEKVYTIPIKSAGTGRILVSANPTGSEEKKRVVERSITIKAEEDIDESIKRIEAIVEDVDMLKERIKEDIKERVLTEGLSHLTVEEEVRKAVEEMIEELERKYKVRVRSFVVNVDKRKARISLEYSPGVFGVFRRAVAPKIEMDIARGLSEKFELDIKVEARQI